MSSHPRNATFNCAPAQPKNVESKAGNERISCSKNQYEQITPPLSLLCSRGRWFARAEPNCLADRSRFSIANSDGSNVTAKRHSDRFPIGSRGQDSPEAGEKAPR